MDLPHSISYAVCLNEVSLCNGSHTCAVTCENLGNSVYPGMITALSLSLEVACLLGLGFCLDLNCHLAILLS